MCAVLIPILILSFYTFGAFFTARYISNISIIDFESKFMVWIAMFWPVFLIIFSSIKLADKLSLPKNKD